MNAPKERGQEGFMKVQFLLLWKKMISGDFDQMLLPAFREFSKHLPDELSADWERAEKIGAINADPSALSEEERHELDKLTAAYEEHETRLTDFIGTFIEQLDPETGTALTNALEQGDVDQVTSILEKCEDIMERTKDRLEE